MGPSSRGREAYPFGVWVSLSSQSSTVCSDRGVHIRRCALSAGDASHSLLSTLIMLLTTLLTVSTAALAAAAPAPKNKNEFTIRPVSRTDLCLDVQPAQGETATYTLM